jgi:hypothetical protein
MYSNNSQDRKFSVREAAENYISRGWNPVPIGYRSKKPSLGLGWHNVRITPENVTTHFNGAPQNIGVQMGPASDGLTDGDLDSPEARALAPAFLPTTEAVFGRPTAPASHWLYTTDLADSVDRATLQFKDPRKPKSGETPKPEGLLLELRIGGGGKGSQTVLPPSAHDKTGEQIAWVKSGEPARISGAELKRAASLLASCCLLARYWPSDGSGCHYAALTVGGFLARAGLETEEVRNAVDAIACFANPARQEELARTAEDAAVGHDKGERTYGFPELAKTFGEDIAKAVAEWLGYHRDGSSSVFVSSPPEAPEDWPDPKPIPSGLEKVPALDPKMLPDGVAPWLIDISERMQVPPDFVGIRAMVMFGTLLGSKIGIRPKQADTWTEVCNVWGMTVGRPGFMKSPAASEVFRPMLRAAAKADEAYARVADAFEFDLETHTHRRKEAIKQKKAFTDPAPERPKHRRYVTHDATYQKVGELMADNPRGLMLHSDELAGVLRALRQEQNSEARGFYMKCWTGSQTVTFDRIGRGRTHVPNAALSWFGTTQPGAIESFVRQAVLGGKEDDGLIQRFLLSAWPDTAPEWKDVDRYPLKEARDKAYAIFDALDQLDPKRIGAETDIYDDFPYLRFTPEARRLFLDWRGTQIEGRVRGEDLPDALSSHLAKYRGGIARLALITHLVEVAAGSSEGGPVGEKALTKALMWAAYLEPHAIRLYSAGVEPARAAARTLLAKLRAGHLRPTPEKPAFDIRDVYRNCWSGLTEPDHAQAAVDLLCAHDWLWAHHTTIRGRPKTEYLINPRGLP